MFASLESAFVLFVVIYARLSDRRASHESGFSANSRRNQQPGFANASMSSSLARIEYSP